MSDKSELAVKYQNELNLVPLKNFNAKQMDLFFALCARMSREYSFLLRGIKGIE